MRACERSWPAARRRIEIDTHCGCEPCHEKISSLNRECPLGGAVAFQFWRVNPSEPHRNMIPQHRRQERIIERHGTRISIITMVDGDRERVGNCDPLQGRLRAFSSLDSIPVPWHTDNASHNRR